MRERGERGRGREGNKGDWEGEREGIGKEREGRRMGKEGRGKEMGGEKEGKGRGNGEGRGNKIVVKYTPKRTKLHHFLTIFSGACPETPLAKHHFSKINLNCGFPPPLPI